MTVTPDQRRIVRELAGGCCEFCRLSEANRLVRFHIDHIIPVKHGGQDMVDNLCLACLECNSYKGPNVAALDPLTQDATKLYNPRLQNWHQHFELQADASFVGLTPEGRATILVLRMNDKARVEQRFLEMQLGEYPCFKV